MDNVQNEWRNFCGLVTWWTHGSETTAADVFNSSRCVNLDNDHPSFTFQNSCNNGYPEVAGNLGYSLLKNGAIGTISASRVSWYAPGDSNWDISGINSYMADRYSKKIIEKVRAGKALFDMKMAASPSAMSRWMNFLVFNLYGDPALKIDDAGGFATNPGEFIIYNDGTGTLEVSGMSKRDGDAWLSWSPTSPLTIPAGGSRVIAVSVDWNQFPGTSDSERIVVTSNDVERSPYPNGVFINGTAAVDPGILSVTPMDGLSSTGSEGGPFTPTSKGYTLQNTGGSAINWTASKGEAWVSLSSTSGTLAPNATATVTVSINSTANGLSSGAYNDAVNFNNTTNGTGNTTRGIQLVVGAAGLCGDTNENNRVDIGDAMFIAQWLVGNRDSSALNLDVGDTNVNNRVDIGDAMFIAQYLVGNRNCLCEGTGMEVCAQ